MIGMKNLNINLTVINIVWKESNSMPIKVLSYNKDQPLHKLLHPLAYYASDLSYASRQRVGSIWGEGSSSNLIGSGDSDISCSSPGLGASFSREVPIIVSGRKKEPALLKLSPPWPHKRQGSWPNSKKIVHFNLSTGTYHGHFLSLVLFPSRQILTPFSP